MSLRAILAPVFVALVVLGAALPASAATPAATPVLRSASYTGTSTTTTTQAPVQSAVLPAKARVDCSDSNCVLAALSLDDSEDGVPDYDLLQGRSIALTRGAAQLAMPASGNICDNVWLPTGTLSITATTTGFSGTRTGGETPYTNCPDGSSTSSGAFILTFAMKLTAGDPCAIDGSCATPTPAPGAVVAASGPIPPSSHRAASVPSVLSALPDLVQAVTVRNTIWAAATAVVLVLLIAIPTHFFNQAASRANELFEKWWRRRRPARAAKPAPDAPVRLAGWPLAAGGVVAASLISAFVDPSFGFDAASVRTFASILVSFIIDVVIGWFALLLIVRKTHPSSTAKFEFKPLTLLIVVVAVLFTRLTSFQPGIVFGLVAGVAFGGLLATAEKARVALIGLAWSFGIGIVAWVGYTVLLANSGDHPGAVTVFVRETLSGIAIAGASSLPIALLPLRGLTGAVVWQWKKWVWGVAYAVGLFGFMVMLMPMPFSWQKVPLNLVVWIALYLAYAVVAVGLWLLVERPWSKEPSSGGGSVDRAAEAPVA